MGAFDMSDIAAFIALDANNDIIGTMDIDNLW